MTPPSEVKTLSIILAAGLFALAEQLWVML